MNETPTTAVPHTFSLRDLPLAARLTLALFLISVGIGYVSALVQLHFQHAAPGEMLPSMDDAVKVFYGHVGAKPQCKIEQLLPEDYKGKKMSRHGQMTSAFYKDSEDYDDSISDKAAELAKKQGVKPNDPAIKKAAKAEVNKERNAERLAMIAWIHAGSSEAAYDDNQFTLPDELAKAALTRKYLVQNDGQIADPHAVKIQTLFQERCANCHKDGGDPLAQKIPLTSFVEIKKCATVKTASGMSLDKLAQTTHVHLLGFSMLYGLTGLILAFTSYPRLLRILLCPLPLLAQVVDISFWWLGRLPEPEGPMFARAVVISGAVVAVGLLLHIVLSLFNLFRTTGWVVLIVLFAVAGYGTHEVKKHVIDPFIAKEIAPNPAAK